MLLQEEYTTTTVYIKPCSMNCVEFCIPATEGHVRTYVARDDKHKHSKVWCYSVMGTLNYSLHFACIIHLHSQQEIYAYVT